MVSLHMAELSRITAALRQILREDQVAMTLVSRQLGELLAPEPYFKAIDQLASQGIVGRARGHVAVSSCYPIPRRLPLSRPVTPSFFLAGNQILKEQITSGKTIDQFLIRSLVDRDAGISLSEFIRPQVSNTRHLRKPLDVSLIASSTTLRASEREIVRHLTAAGDNLVAIEQRIGEPLSSPPLSPLSVSPPTSVVPSAVSTPMPRPMASWPGTLGSVLGSSEEMGLLAIPAIAAAASELKPASVKPISTPIFGRPSGAGIAVPGAGGAAISSNARGSRSLGAICAA
jgi:hypothetical protein